jgi:hypothetical protein
MDAAFEILLPIDTGIPFRFEQPTFEWDCVKYPQGAPEFLYDSNYKLIKTPIRPYIISKLPDSYQKVNWECIALLGDGLQNYRTNLLDKGPSYYDDVLSQLLEDLLAKATKWVVVFEPDYDFPNEVLEGTLSTVIDKIRYSLGIEKSGYIVYGANVVMY